MDNNSRLKKILSLIKADYTSKQKIISFFISLGFSLVIAIAISINLLAATESPDYNPLSSIDNLIVDNFFIRRYKSADIGEKLRGDASQALTLVKIDDDSLTRMELSWPIPRSTYARLLEKLKIGKAKTIGFDIIFADPSTPEEDEKLANTLAGMDNVFLSEYFYVSREKLDPGQMGTQGEEKDKLEVVKPYRMFYESLGENPDKRLGFVSAHIGRVVRRMFLSAEIGGEKHLALSAALAADYMEIPLSEIRYQDDGRYFQIGKIKIPAVKRLIRINYLVPPGESTLKFRTGQRAAELINEFSLKDILLEMDDDLLRAAFENKIVLIGPTAEGAGDIKLTPFGHIPGVYSHANIILSILNREFLKTTPPVYNILFILILGIVIGLVLPRLSPPAGGIMTVLICLGYYQYTYYDFVNNGIINYISSPILVVFFSFVVVNVYHHIAESKTKESFSRMFREFAPVPSNLIEKYIEESGGSAATGGELEHMTILFADIRGYTQMSEKMSSQEVMDVLNKYHQEMGSVFEQTGGVVFTYIGDAQLVVYGLEGISKVNHAAAAIKAGLMMQEKMKEIRQELEQQGKMVFEVGVGICTGSLSVGVVGSKQLKQYTVIGDTVNVASRIQGMSRELNAPVLVHERTYLMAKHCVEAERLRPVKLKGKKELVNVYRCKAVKEIEPYPGDEIKDLDREVEELHARLKEEREKRRKEREKARQEKEAKGAGEEKTIPAGVRRRGRRSRRLKKESPGPKTPPEKSWKEDDAEPLQEKSKGSVADEDNLEPLEEKTKGEVPEEYED